MEVIPAVDVLDGRVVRLVEGDFARVTDYGEDPVIRARAWIDEGAARVHVVDLSGAKQGRSSPGLAAALAEHGVIFQVGGGFRDAESVLAAVTAGAGRVVVGTAAVERPDVLEEMVDAVGAERIVVAIDVREGRSRGSGWLDEGRAWQDVVSDVVRAGAVRALVTGIDRDGTFSGPDLQLAASVAELAPELAVIASGGVGSIEHVTAAARASVEALVVGKALYDGRVSLADALRAASG